MIDLLRVIILLIVFLTPLLIATPSLGYEQIKVFFFSNLVIIAFLIWIQGTFSKKIKLPKSKLVFISSLFFLSLGISSIFGGNFWHSFFGQQPYFQGYLVYLFLFILFLISSSINLKISELAWVLTSSSLIVSAIAIRDWTNLHLLHTFVPTYAGRIVSSFGQPNLYSGFLLITIPFWFEIFKKKKQFALLGILVSAVAIFLSESRAAIFTLSLVGLIFFAIKIFTKAKGRQKILGAVVLLIGLFIFLSAVLSLYNKEIGNWESKIWEDSLYQTYSPEKRVFIWPEIGNLISKQPFFGYGLENLSLKFNQSVESELTNRPYSADLKNLNVDKSHNYSLDLLFDGGIIGFGLWVFVIFLAFRKTQSSRLKFFILIYAIWIQFQIQGIVHLMLFWTTIGLIDSL